MRIYRDLYNQVRSAVRTDKNEWLQQKCIEINKNSTESFTLSANRLIKNVKCKWKPKQLITKDSSDKVFQPDEEIKKRWTEYSSQFYKKKPNPDMSVIGELEEITPRHNDGDNIELRCMFRNAKSWWRRANKTNSQTIL